MLHNEKLIKIDWSHYNPNAAPFQLAATMMHSKIAPSCFRYMNIRSISKNPSN